MKNIDYHALFQSKSESDSKFHVGQLLYAPEGGIRKVAVQEVKIFPSVHNVIYMCTDCITGESCAYNENELFSLGEREKCLEVWMNMEYQTFHYKGSDLSVDQQSNFGILYPHALNGRHIYKINVSILNENLIFQDDGEKCILENAENTIAAYEQAVNFYKKLALKHNATIIDMPERKDFPDMFRLDNGTYVDWKTYVAENAGNSVKLRKTACDIAK